MALTTQSFIPKGFTAGRHPMISSWLQARIDRVGRNAGPQRLVVQKASAAKAEAVQAFLAEKPLWGARAKAPGVYEIDCFIDDIARLTERKDLFQWIDIATRLSGKVPESAGAAAVVRLVGAETATEKALKSLGGTATSRSPGMVEGKLAAGRLGDLLRAEKVETIEVLGAA